MANPEHIKMLKKSIDYFNKWQRNNVFRWERELTNTKLVQTDLSGADLSGVDLSEADLRYANLSEAHLSGLYLSGANLSGAHLDKADLTWAHLNGANLSGANLRGASLASANLSGADLKDAILTAADLRKADLSGANLSGANLSGAELMSADLRKADFTTADLTTADLSVADFRKANLSGAKLSWANLSYANLGGADLSGVNLEMANLIEVNLEEANISNSRIYGISAWDLKLSQETKQLNLIITKNFEPVVTVDNLEVAQFVYLLLNNKKIREVIDTITSKAVLILGRFTDERKDVLDAIREELRKHNYVPILFDFEKPDCKDLTETIVTLANMVRFIIADITEPRSIPHELATIVPTNSVPVQPLLLDGSTGEYAMFKDLMKYSWVLSIYHYKTSDDLLKYFNDKIVLPCEKKVKELLVAKQ